MATQLELWLPPFKGRSGQPRSALVKQGAPQGDGMGAGMAAFLGGQLLFQNTFPVIGGFWPYTTGQWTVTTTGTGATVTQATTDGGGLLLTAGSTSTFNTNLQSIQTLTLASGRKFGAAFRLQVSDITAVGFSLGFGASNVDPITSEYTNAVFLRKTAAGATLIGNVRGASGTIAASGTLATLVNTTEIMCGFYGVYSTTAANCSGAWWTYDTTNGYLETPFTAAQLTQLAAMTGTCYYNLNAKGSAGNPTVTVTSAFGYWDNAY